MLELVNELKTVTTQILECGGPKAIQKHVSKGKLMVRDRINTVLDKNSAFLELSSLAAYKMYGKDVINSSGIVSGIGRVHGYLFVATYERITN